MQKSFNSSPTPLLELAPLPDLGTPSLSVGRPARSPRGSSRNRPWPKIFLAGLLLSCGFDATGKPIFTFRDVTQETGLLKHLEGIRGHAAGWGDPNQDGRPDLYVGTFDTGSSRPNLLLWNKGGHFEPDDQGSLRISSRSSAAVFADLDNDGMPDLYISSMPAPKGSQWASRAGHPLSGCRLFHNTGHGRFEDISTGNASCPKAFGGRSATAFDYNGDGLLDLLVGEDPIPGYNGSSTHSSRLFRNKGDLEFEEVTQEVGIPQGIPGLGVAAGDLNNDTWPDLFIASNDGGNRLFLNNREGGFYEVGKAASTFAWDEAGGDNMVCGVAFGDVNADGRLDIVMGQHFEQPWVKPVANRLFLNQGSKEGPPHFREITQEAGLAPIPIKAPHVELRDFDNDGEVDLYTSVVMFGPDRPHPLIFRNTGAKQGIPQFRQQALRVNDFPTSQDRRITDSGRFFEKMVSEKKVLYTAPGPSSDYNRDGRLDLFLASWWPELPSLLLRNETEGGHWLQVEVTGFSSVNRMGVGSRINLYAPGKLGEQAGLLASQEIALGFGYASSHMPTAHFGLGNKTRCDVEVLLPHEAGRVVMKAVEADQRITVKP